MVDCLSHINVLDDQPISRSYLASRDRSQALTLPFRVQTQIVQSLLDQVCTLSMAHGGHNAVD